MAPSMSNSKCAVPPGNGPAGDLRKAIFCFAYMKNCMRVNAQSQTLVAAQMPNCQTQSLIGVCSSLRPLLTLRHSDGLSFGPGRADAQSRAVACLKSDS